MAGLNPPLIPNARTLYPKKPLSVGPGGGLSGISVRCASRGRCANRDANSPTSISVGYPCIPGINPSVPLNVPSASSIFLSVRRPAPRLLDDQPLTGGQRQNIG